MKKLLLMVVVMFTMTMVANAKDYVGDVTNVLMGGDAKSDVSNITFEVNDGVLSAVFDVPDVFPPHHIEFSVPITGVGAYDVKGTVTVFGKTVPFNGTVTVTRYDEAAGVLAFNFACPSLGVSFVFTCPGA